MLCFASAQSPLRHHLELQESSKKPAKLTAWRVFCFLRLQRSPATSFDIPHYWALHQRRGQAGSTPKTGASPFSGHFSDRFLNNSPAISAAQNAHSQAVVIVVAEAIRTPLDQLHFMVKTFCDAVIYVFWHSTSGASFCAPWQCRNIFQAGQERREINTSPKRNVAKHVLSGITRVCLPHASPPPNHWINPTQKFCSKRIATNFVAYWHANPFCTPYFIHLNKFSYLQLRYTADVSNVLVQFIWIRSLD